MEGLRKQYNYLVDEACTPGVDGSGAKGPDGVISMLHHCLENFGLREKVCSLHCDNAGGKWVTQFLNDDLN